MSGRLIDQLTRRGIRVRRVGADQLGVTGPERELSAEAIAFLRENKAALLAELADQPPTAPPELPSWLDPRFRQAAIEAGSIIWLDQVLLWPAEVYRAWEVRVKILTGDLSREEARERAYLEYRHH